MGKKKIIIWSILAVIVLWMGIGITDYVRVTLMNRKPIFCISTEESHYEGLGYSYDIYSHPITGKNEYAFYIMGEYVESTFTNGLVEM